jgi:hypothetical protein
VPNINPIILLNGAPPSGWWVRPEEWLPMPTIADNTAHGLFAVFEDEINGLAIQVQNGTHTIIWGDGSTNSTGSGTQTYNHVYDYSTLSGSSYVFTDGRNYKMVMVTIEFTNATTLVNIGVPTTPASGTANRIQNWLDFQINSTRVNGCQLQYTTYFVCLLQRLNLVGEAWVSGFSSPLSRALNLRVLGCDFSKPYINQLSGILSNFLGDLRDINGDPIIINSLLNSSNVLNGSRITEIGDVILPNSTTALSFMQSSSIRKCGSISIPNVTSLSDAFRDCPIETLSISVNLLQNITRVVLNCLRLSKLEFIGTMANVTTTAQAFNSCISLRRLILPNLSIGFDISATQVSGQNLQDLFISLGNASGSQTITLPTFTIGEPTTVATNKGYIIAYA